MIRILEDLQSYARMHGLSALAVQLDQTRLLALAEIANLPGNAPPGEADDTG
ncbi:MAG: hypothetical protein ACK4GT_12410 [Pararhodobacter sp.]